MRLRFHRPYEGRGNLVIVLLDSGQAYTATARGPKVAKSA